MYPIFYFFSGGKMKELKIINKNIKDIKEYENNAKEHPDWQIEQIANSINEFGLMTQ